jgi:hypothetical protein
MITWGWRLVLKPVISRVMPKLQPRPMGRLGLCARHLGTKT